MSNFNLHGLSVSSGIAIGKAYLLSDALVEVEHYAINKKDITKEVKRLKLAINQVNKDLNKIKKDFFKISLVIAFEVKDRIMISDFFIRLLKFFSFINFLLLLSTNGS